MCVLLKVLYYVKRPQTPPPPTKVSSPRQPPKKSKTPKKLWQFYLVTVVHVVERVGEGLRDGMALRDDRGKAWGLAPRAVAAGGVEGVLLFGVVAVGLDELHSVDGVLGKARGSAGGDWPGEVGTVVICRLCLLLLLLVAAGMFIAAAATAAVAANALADFVAGLCIWWLCVCTVDG
jgi:hypothetical protein